MHTISTFATKGGAGRSTTVMALSCGFIALGKRVAVLDCTGQISWQMGQEMSTTLEAWRSHMQTADYSSGRIELIQCHSQRQVEDKWAAAKTCGFDVLLIDTQHRLEDRQSAALGLADLIVAPATGPLEARCTASSVKDILGFPENLLGLVTGCRNGEQEITETRAAFGDTSVFLSVLPYAKALADLTLIGDVERFAASLTCKNEEPGFARYQGALATWLAVQQLTFEVQWALNGQRLQLCNSELPKPAFRVEAFA